MNKAASSSMRRCFSGGVSWRFQATDPASWRKRSLATAIFPARNALKEPYIQMRQQSEATFHLHASSPRSYSSTGPSGYEASTSIRNSIPRQVTYSDDAVIEAPPHLNEAEREIYDVLALELQPTRLEVRDISGGCGSMYAIDIVSERFRGVGMLMQQRIVYGVLGERVKAWHGVQLKTRTP